VKEFTARIRRLFGTAQIDRLRADAAWLREEAERRPHCAFVLNQVADEKEREAEELERNYAA